MVPRGARGSPAKSNTIAGKRVGTLYAMKFTTAKVAPGLTAKGFLDQTSEVGEGDAGL